MRWQAVKDQNDALRVDLDGSIDTMLESALNSRNKAERLAQLGAIEDAINRARDTGVLSYAQAKQYHKAKLEKFDELTVSRVMRTQPSLALSLLGDKSATPNLDPLPKAEQQVLLGSPNQVETVRASRERRAPNFALIEQIVSEAFMPVCYGGGVASVEDARHSPFGSS